MGNTLEWMAPALFVTAAALQLPILLPGLLFIAAIKQGWLAWLNVPIDRGLTLGGKPVLGPNKTWRAVVFYTLGATIVCAFLQLIFPEWFIHHAADAWFVGPALGLTYSAGELVNSFVKRRLGIGAGGVSGMVGRKSTTKTRLSKAVQAVFDSIDGALATGIVYLVIGVSWPTLLVSLAFTLIIHASTDYLMRRLALKK